MKATIRVTAGLVAGLMWLSGCETDQAGTGSREGSVLDSAGTPAPTPTPAPAANDGSDAQGAVAAMPGTPGSAMPGSDMADMGRLPDVEVWMPPDAGVRDNPDPTVPADGSRVCSPVLLALGQGTTPACTAETGMCVVACASQPDDARDACRDACSAADTYVGGDLECSGCLGLRPLSCFDDNGCSINPLYCCLEDNCQLGDDACTEAKCSLELQALFSCVVSQPAALTCLDYQNGPVANCFAPPE